jgi:hypothetical protein
MSLLRLLTAGKTLIGLKRSESRYQLPGGKGLPMFGSKKNPFRATVFPDKAESAPVAEDTVEELSAVPAVNTDSPPSQAPAPAPNDLPPHEDNQSNGARAFAVSAPKEPQAKEQLAGQPAPRRSSALKALLLWRRVKKSNSQGPFKGRPLVQAELSLESVRVVRNDLSESDLEVVQTTSRRQESACPGAADERKAHLPSMNWSPSSGQLVSAGKT